MNGSLCKSLTQHGAMLLGISLLLSCATVEAPKGGPEDKLPPRVVAVSPAPRSLNTARKLDVQIQFNEWIMNPVPRSAIRISPPIEGKLETEVDGDLLMIRSKASLDTLTTYTLTVSSVLEDLHKNPVSKPFQLVFATGPVVDTLRVRGQVLLPDSLVRQKRYPTVGLFPIGTSARSARNYLAKLRDSSFTGPDSIPRLGLEPALYIGQTDSNGWFQIDGVAKGNYRVLAFLDQNGDNRIDPSIEIGGLADRDLVVDTAIHDTLHWAMANLDTAHPLLSTVTPISPLAATLEFSQIIKADSLAKANCSLRRTDSSLYSKAKALWLALDPKRLVVAFDSALVDSTVLVGCDPKNLQRITWFLPKDTLVQRLLQFRLIGPSPATDSLPSLELTYNIPIQPDTLSPRLRIVAGKDSLPVSVKQSDPVRLLVTPAKPLPMGINFKLVQINQDTSKSKQAIQLLGAFETISPIKLSRLLGHVRNGMEKTRVRIRAPGKPYVWTTLCSKNGEFKLEQIPEGPYLMDAFHDLDLDSIPGAGSLFPYKPAESWRAIPDTIRVGNDLLPTTLDSILFHYPLPQRTP